MNDASAFPVNTAYPKTQASLANKRANTVGNKEHAFFNTHCQHNAQTAMRPESVSRQHIHITLLTKARSNSRAKGEGITAEDFASPVFFWSAARKAVAL
jgi:hypothetical protein